MSIKQLFYATRLFYRDGELPDQASPSGEAGFEHKSVRLHVLGPKHPDKLYCTLVTCRLLPSISTLGPHVSLRGRIYESREVQLLFFKRLYKRTINYIKNKGHKYSKLLA